jgi:hypothetical protein
MVVEAAVLARAIAVRINPMLPTGIRAWEEDGWLVVSDGKMPAAFAVDDIDVSEGDSAHLMAEVSRRLIGLLNSLQDDVIRTVNSPWPVSADQPFGDAFAKAEGSVVIAGYGSEEEPVLALAPITLEELLRHQES